MIHALNLKMWRDLKQLRPQAVTIALLVACGVALLIASWSAYKSLRKSRDHYYTQYRFAQIFGDFKRAPNDVATKLRNISGIETLETRITIEGLVDLSGQEEPAVGHFISVPSGKESLLNQVYLRSGRLPVDADPVEVVIHEGFANAHNLRPGDHLSVLIQGHREDVTVSGIGISPEYVYALSAASPLPDDRHFGVFWVPLRDLERMAGMTDAFNNVSATLAPGASFGRIKEEMDRILKIFGNRGIYGRDKQLSSMFVDDEITQQKISAFFLPSIFLGIAAFLIHVISTRLIAIHRPQIATLKAIGYTNSEVSLHYVKLITLMMLFGALPGIGLGSLIGRWMARMYEDFFRFPSLDFSLSTPAALIGLAAGVLPGMLGAWSSIRNVFLLSPAEAMQPLAPPTYQLRRVERWVVRPRFGVAGKMVARNLMRRPARLVATIFGMSLALAIVISSGFWKDTLEYMLTTQFQRIQREDLTVSFLRPVHSGGLRELETFKGVQKVEGYRLVPIRLKYLNHQKEALLTGWPKDATLRTRLDSRFNVIPLPATAALLGRYFERKWGVRVGDFVEFETLEGEQKSIPVRVAGFTDDLLGVSVSMNIEDVWAALSEEPAYNLAALKTDPLHLNALYVQLKNMPIAEGVVLKKASYQGISNTMVKMVRTMTVILLGFALTISLGIIYNSVRVSFSERSWEMASLRVMGFNRSYVFKLLLAEVSLQLGLSIIPGCIMGLGLAHLSLMMLNTETFGFPVIVARSTYAQAVTVTLVAFAVSAWIVYRLMGKLSLADALKARE